MYTSKLVGGARSLLHSSCNGTAMPRTLSSELLHAPKLPLEQRGHALAHVHVLAHAVAQGGGVWAGEQVTFDLRVLQSSGERRGV